MEVTETVNHPPHYGGEDNPYECIRVLEAWLSPEQLRGFLIGNTIKYLCRAGKKGNLLEDLYKARWCLNFLVEKIEKELTPSAFPSESDSIREEAWEPGGDRK